MGSFRLWDLERDVDTHRFKDHDFAVTGLAISPDGQQFLTTSYDGTIRQWDIASGRQLALLTDHREWAWAVAYGPGGDFAVSAGGGGRCESARRAATSPCGSGICRSGRKSNATTATPNTDDRPRSAGEAALLAQPIKPPRTERHRRHQPRP